MTDCPEGRPPAAGDSGYLLAASRRASNVKLLGLSMGRPRALDQTPCDKTPSARETPNSTV